MATSGEPRACPFCGAGHDIASFGMPGGAFDGIKFVPCPKVPSGFVYEDREFDRGPRGALHRLVERPQDAPTKDDE
jgi:hypothetical protein